MKIVNCTAEDVQQVLYLYEAARVLQSAREMVVWPDFDVDFLYREVAAGRQWKLESNGIILANWTNTFSDPDIWEARDREDAIYFHRICTHPEFRGQRLIDRIVAWGCKYAWEKGRRYVRLDTLGNNARLIRHYTSAGFQFLGMVQLRNTGKLPLHYQQEPRCCLFELSVGEGGCKE